MKIWKGPEMEGYDKGVITLFIKDESFSGEVALRYLKENPDCKRLYLGAGRTDVTSLWPTDDQDIAISDLKELFSYCTLNNIHVMLETTYAGLMNCPDELFEATDEITIRIMSNIISELVDNIKIDTETDVYITKIENMVRTDLSTLNKDMFSVDTILFSNEEEEYAGNIRTN